MNKLLVKVKAENQDFEWYPTTDEIIQTIRNDIYSEDSDFDEEHEIPTVLDCGAGDGRVLNALTTSKRYAIEKSVPLLNALDKDIFIVGTEFQEQTLIDKKVDIVFSNPPYSEYEQWAIKIIKEANARCVYLVIPHKWGDVKAIQDAIDRRDAETKVLGKFYFTNAERKARAIVNVVKIQLAYTSWHNRKQLKTDPFDVWFNDNFKLNSKVDDDRETKPQVKEALKTELVAGNDVVSALVKLYQRDMEKLLLNYKALESLDYALLDELGLNLGNLLEALKLKITGLKDLYWNELFNNLTKITDKLTYKTRTMMLDKLTAHTHVDFTASNAYAVLVWVLKNANVYFDEQLINLVERMVDQDSIVMYKSNIKVFRDEDWRYGRPMNALDNYKLDYRIVLHRVGGICTSSWHYDQTRHNGLDEGAYYLINDIMTIANNLGFDTSNEQGARQYEWESNQAKSFYYTDAKGRGHLFDVRAFKNGNLHIKFNSKFICKLNVEFGRLKGWLKTAKQASEELDIPETETAEYFNTNLQLGSNNLLRLCFDDEL